MQKLEYSSMQVRTLSNCSPCSVLAGQLGFRNRFVASCPGLQHIGLLCKPFRLYFRYAVPYVLNSGTLPVISGFRIRRDCMAKSTASLRVLLADDFEAFRRVAASILQKQPDLQIVCEVSDGLEAVQRAEQLQPDLILLDIGLPNLNGIEAASRIRQVAPGAKILFLTQHSDDEIVAAALSTGAQGYVLKKDAGRELLTGVAGILAGNDFVSSGIEPGDSGETEEM